MRKIVSLFSLVLSIIFFSENVFAQTTVSVPLTGNYLFNSATARGAIVFGIKNNNSTSVVIDKIGNYVPAGFNDTLTLWRHETNIAGAPTAINTTNGWVQTAVGIINNTTAELRDVFTNVNLVIPAGVTYRFAISGPPGAPFYSGAGSTLNSYINGGVEILTNANPNSPGYGGGFPGPPANTPRCFQGSVTFSIPPAGVANNASAFALSLPTNFCKGNQSVAVKVLNNGNNVINNLQLNWEVDGISQTPLTYSTPIDTVGSLGGNEAIVTLGNVNFGNAAKNIKVWTSLPNGLADPIPADDTLQVMVRAKMSGDYTIGGVAADFASFNDAVNALAAGICGSVNINVNPGTGPYTEQVTIPTINGVSTTNRITINGNNNIIQFAPTTSARHIIQLANADFITLKNLQIKGLATDFGWGIHLLYGSDRDSIVNCTIDLSLVTATAQAASGGIVASNSLTSTTTVGNNASYLTVLDNTIIGGYQGIILNGNTGSVNGISNRIINNIIRDFYATGIELVQNDGALVAYNNISRANRVAVTTFTGIELGAGNINCVVDGNKVHDTHNAATTQSGTSNGISSTSNDAPSGSENKIINNLIYNINSTTGIIYGLYNSGSDGVKYYHNTVVLNHAGSTSGTTRGFFQTAAATNIDVKNNIIFINRGGSGVKYCLYFGTTTSTITSNNNLLFNISSTGTNGIGSFGTAGSATLALWQAANSNAYDQQSVNINPAFLNPASADYTPTEPTINNIGVNVGVTTDINNAARGSSPDPGAYEFSLDGCTSPVNAGVAISTATNLCAGSIFTLNLTGNSTGVGMNYQWQQSSTGNAPWTNVGSLSVNSFLDTFQAVTNYYRCVVRCNTGIADTSTVVQITSPALVSGNFTINSSLPTGSGNFQTFAEAISYIACGINGPVNFNVEVGSGPYNEQFTIPQIFGTNATNRVTIKGNGAIIQFDPVTANRHVIKLDGADYITLDSLDIRTTTTTDFGWGIHLTNGANYDSIKNCIISIGSTSATQSNSAGIVASGTSASVTTAGSASHNVIIGNTISGAYQGIILTGTATSLNGVKNQVIRNSIKDFYSNGIIITHNDSTIIANNDISRPTRQVVTTFHGVELGAGNIKCIVDGNKIHDTHNSATTQTGAAYGVYSTANDATVGNENKIINNLIYNFNSGSGIIYGLYNSSSDGVKYYHNTVVLDHAAATDGVTRGFYQVTAATNIDFRNNIIYINRGGTGIKYCVYFGTTTSTIISNNNVLYNISGSGTNGIGSFGTAGSADLTAWKSANSGAYDQQSVSVDPLFTDVNLQDYTPTETTVENIGANVGVSKDINGLSRVLAAPDPGAFEVPASAGIDLRVEQLVSPAISAKGCYHTENIEVTIRNNAATPINFATRNATITVTVAGVVNTVYTATINTGTLASGAALNVSVFAPSSTIDMSGLGNYNFTVTVDVTGDVNPSNNTINVDRAKLSLTGGIATATPENYCAVGGTPKLTSTDAEGYNVVKWQQSINGGVSYTDIANSDTLVYTLTTPIAQNTYFRMVAVCGTNEQNSTEDSVIINNPQILTSLGATRCGPGTLTLNATAAPSATIKWYATPTSTSALATGETFVTPNILNTTTYYAAASDGGSTVLVGKQSPGTATNLSASPRGIQFNALNPFILESVKIYSTSSTAGSGTITLLDGAGNTVGSPVNVTWPGGGSASSPIAQTLSLNLNVPVGNGYLLMMTSFGTGGIAYESSGMTPAAYAALSNSDITFVGSMTSLTALSTSTYYYFYDWQITTGCEGTRTAVVATITAPPTITASTLDTITCNGANASLVVNTANTNYTFSWTPGAQTNDTIIVAPTTTTKYYVNATDAGTGCTAIDSVTVWVQPVSTIDASPATFCVTGDTSILRLSPLTGYAPNTIQWQTSSNNVTYTDIPGATASTYITPVNNSTTYYKALIKNGAGLVCSDSVQKISVNNPLITGTTPATRCGPGSVTLNATAASTATIKWYANTTSTSALATGSSFVTPTILNTTTYYVAATEGTTIGFVGKKSPGTATNLLASPRGIQFDAVKGFVLESVKIYSTSANAGSGTITLLNASGNTIGSAVNVTWPGGGTAAAPIAHTLNLNLSVPQGNGYRLMMTSFATGGIAYESSGMTAAAYTALSNSSITFVGSMTSLTGLSTTTYYYFYDWSITTDCESARTPVTATITAATSITASTLDSVVCNGANAALSVSSSNSNYTYSWTPSSLNGNSIVVNPTQTTKYFVNASDAGTGCTALDSVTVRVQPRSSISASPNDFCVVGGVTTLSLNPLTGYAPNTIQWQTSNNNQTFTDITGATNATYTSPIINATTYFKAIVKNGAGAICSDSVKAVFVNNPTIITTTPATRCGSGTLALGATTSAGFNVNWYADATGGSPLFTGNTFTTPSISTTTNYYAAAGYGSNERVGRIAPNISTTLSTATRGIFFNATQAFTLKSVVVYPFSAGSGTVAVQSSTGSTLAGPINITWPAGTSGTTPHTILLNMNIPAGNDMFLVMTTMSGNLTYEIAANFNGTYPYNSPSSIVSITASRATTTTPSTTTYYYFYDWEISTGCESARTLVTATVDNTPGCNALPVGLLNFKGIREGNINRLTWTTTTETNNAGFTIERSADGRSFSPLSYVTSKAENGNSSSNLNYSFTDTKVLSGNNYYRLKQMDKDGKATYSSIVLIKGEKVRTIMITGLYPNPVSNELKMTIEAPNAEKVTVIITDVTGKTVLQANHNLIAGTNTLQLPTANLANGNYFVKMICANGCETTTTKFVKQ